MNGALAPAVRYCMNRLLAIIAAGLLFFAAAQGPSDKSIEAARLNNLGAAYMNQQLFEKGLKNFQDAAELDPKLEIAKLNQGIAQLNLTRIDPARGLLEQAVKDRPDDPNAWFNLGLLYKNTDNPQGAVDAFVRVTKIDANDADTWYFLGASYSQDKQFPHAIDAFQHALKLNPLHASAEFGISRAYQQSGEGDYAHEHLKKFQYIKDNKLGSPMSLAYGEQGKYSRAEESAGAMATVLPAIPVKFVDVTAEAGIKALQLAESDKAPGGRLGPGACFLDFDGDGKIDLFLPDGGPGGGVVLYHNRGGGEFEDVTKKAGLDPSLHAIGCAAGD